MSTTGGKIPSNIIGIGPGEHGEKNTAGWTEVLCWPHFSLLFRSDELVGCDNVPHANTDTDVPA